MQIDGLVGGNVSSSSRQNAPCWTLCVSGRIFSEGSPSDESEESDLSLDFCDLFEEITFELPTDLYPRDGYARWVRGNSPPIKSGFCLRREGSRDCSVRLRLRPRRTEEPRYALTNPALSTLLGFQTGSVQELLQAFWAYVGGAGLVEERDSLFVRLDEALLRALNAGNHGGAANAGTAAEGSLALNGVLDRLRGFLVEANASVEVEYTLRLGGASGGSGRSEPTVVEFEVPVLDSSARRLRKFLDTDATGATGELATQCAELESEIESKIDELEERGRKRAFLRGLSERPALSLRRATDSLILDLETLRTDGSGPHCALSAEEARRSHIWQEPWVDEACLHYLWSQVCSA
jgi:hypothetical protein